MKKDNCFGNNLEYYKLVAGHLFLFVVIIVCIFTGFDASAQNSTSLPPKDSAFIYDDISMQVLLEESKSFHINVLYTHSNLLYVRIEDLFKKLNINSTLTHLNS